MILINNVINKMIAVLSKFKKDEKAVLISESVYMNTISVYEKYNIGDWTYGNPEVLDWNDGTTLNIGKFCSIAKDVKIFLGGEHYYNYVSMYPFNKLFLKEISKAKLDRKTKGNVYIGNDVWIGRGAYILSGVSIGNGAVIGAGSVVSSNIPAYAIVAGNPAKIIKYRFDEYIIKRLEALCWWDWDEEEIKSKIYILMNEPDKL